MIKAKPAETLKTFVEETSTKVIPQLMEGVRKARKAEEAMEKSQPHFVFGPITRRS